MVFEPILEEFECIELNMAVLVEGKSSGVVREIASVSEAPDDSKGWWIYIYSNPRCFSVLYLLSGYLSTISSNVWFYSKCVHFILLIKDKCIPGLLLTDVKLIFSD